MSLPFKEGLSHRKTDLKVVVESQTKRLTGLVYRLEKEMKERFGFEFFWRPVRI